MLLSPEGVNSMDEFGDGSTQPMDTIPTIKTEPLGTSDGMPSSPSLSGSAGSKRSGRGMPVGDSCVCLDHQRPNAASLA